MCVDAVEINSAQIMTTRRHGDHSAGRTLLETLQQKIGQQEWTDMIDTEDHPDAIFSASWSAQSLTTQQTSIIHAGKTNHILHYR